MTDDLLKFEGWMKAGIEALSPSKRRHLFRDIAREVRKSNQRRITQQESPTGTKWAPRKHPPKKHGKIQQKKKMMLGLRKARLMRIKAQTDGASIGYEGRNARIAAVHQFGGMDFVTKDGPKVRYPIRALLGLNDQDRNAIQDIILNHLTNPME